MVDFTVCNVFRHCTRLRNEQGISKLRRKRQDPKGRKKVIEGTDTPTPATHGERPLDHTVVEIHVASTHRKVSTRNFSEEVPRKMSPLGPAPCFNPTIPIPHARTLCNHFGYNLSPRAKVKYWRETQKRVPARHPVTPGTLKGFLHSACHGALQMLQPTLDCFSSRGCQDRSLGTTLSHR